MSLDNIQSRVHFIGVGGAGMSGLARILTEKGISVSGSDIANSKTVNQLKELGVQVFVGHNKNNLSEDVGTVVISTAIPPTNEELIEAKGRGLRIMHRGEVLAELMKEKKGIAVAGAHGKTTTTSMVSLVLEQNGYEPTVVVGGEVFDIGANAKLGSGDYLVAEADESDGSFLKLSPYIAVVTNIENDHLDYWGSTDKIDAAFKEFVNKVPGEGCCVMCFNSPKVRELARNYAGNIVNYGIGVSADYEGRNLNSKGISTTVDVYYKNSLLGTLYLNVPGKHNINNALAALAVGRLVGLSFEEVKLALEKFTGVSRRFQLTGEVHGITVVDDYAHHPTEIKATLEGAKNTGYDRTIAVFQPHRYTRTKFLYKEFGESFHKADMIIINEIYSAGEEPIEGVTAQLIVDEVRRNCDVPVYYLKQGDEIIEFLKKNARRGDLILTLGAGNIWAVGVELVRQLKEGV